MAVRRIGLLGAAAALVLAIASPAAGSNEGELVSCAYLDAGPPGPMGNILRIDDGSRSVTHVYREANAIVVFSNASSDPTTCSGGTPTVFNVDRIEYATTGSAPFFNYLGDGPLAPGASPEGSGPEIEISVKESYDPGVLSVGGTDGDDAIAAGTLGRDRAGINLNVAQDGASPDVDVVFEAPKVARASFKLSGGKGNDQISALGKPGFSGPLVGERVGLSGGPGDDILVGGPSKDRFSGSLGDDTMVGGRGRDYLTIGPGRDLARAGAGPDQIFNVSDVGGIPADRGADRIFAGAGNDRIDASQPMPGDLVDCGPGARDFVFANPGDRTRSCEEVEIVRRRPLW
jgi:Ca2+-binding RTX toxin-like protein